MKNLYSFYGFKRKKKSFLHDGTKDYLPLLVFYYSSIKLVINFDSPRKQAGFKLRTVTTHGWLKNQTCDVFFP